MLGRLFESIGLDGKLCQRTDIVTIIVRAVRCSARLPLAVYMDQIKRARVTASLIDAVERPVSVQRGTAGALPFICDAA